MSAAAKDTPAIDASTLAAIKALVQELKAPSEDEVKAKEARLQSARESGLRAKAEHDRVEATKLICPHKQDQGQSDKSALVFVRGQVGLSDSFIICQCCSKIVKPADPDWNQYVIRCPR